MDERPPAPLKHRGTSSSGGRAPGAAAGYITQISVAYNYRYYAMIPAQERFLKSLVNSFDLTDREPELQKEENDYQQVRANLMISRLELIRLSGALNDFVRRIR